MTLFRREPGKVSRAETRLRTILRRTDVKFEPQKTIKCKNGREYTVDLLVEKVQVVEVDGDVHDTPEQQGQDKQRDKDLAESGYPVLRIRNHEVWNNSRSVVKQILKGVLEQTKAK